MNDHRIALITGANKGIGFETARQLAQESITILLGARDREKGETAAKQLKDEGFEVHPIVIDVTSAESVAAAAERVRQEFGRLDILINNAGAMLDDQAKKPSEQTLEVWRNTFETNLFGMIGVTQAFLPLLRASEAGRIVNLSSILGSITLHSQPDSSIYNFKSATSYNVSKSAVNAWTVQLAHELKDTKIKVNAAHPGWVKTDMGGESAPMEIMDGAKTSVALATLPANGPSGAFLHLGEVLPW